MKTIKELSVELNVSKQAIYKRLHKTHRSTFQPYICLVEKVEYLDEQGIELLKSMMGHSTIQPEVERQVEWQPSTPDKIKDSTSQPEVESITISRNEYDLLYSQIEYLKDQNKIQTEQFNKITGELSEITKSIAHLTYNNQLLLGNEQKNNSVSGPVGATGPVGPEKKFWQFWK